MLKNKFVIIINIFFLALFFLEQAVAEPTSKRAITSAILPLLLDELGSHTFNGGSINDLRAVSPTLVFGDLTIAGKLWIPEAETNVTLNVRNLYLNAEIEVAHPTCKPFSSAPDLTINASGDVVIDAVIDLVGHSGDALAEPPEYTACNDCYGKDGGNLTVSASNIYVNKRIDTSGGWGVNYVWGNTGYPLYQAIRMGCSGGDGGNITLKATGILNISPGGADLDLEGGEGGTGTPYNGGANGTDGNDGVLSWSGATITVAEDPGGTTGELNMYYYNAQWLDYKKLTLSGIVGKNEEADHRGNTGTFAATFPNGFTDYIEDFFCLHLKQYSTIKLALSPANSSADLDLYLINSTLTNIIAQSNGASGSESITSPILSPGKYYVGVSYADDGLNIINVNYTLKFNQ